MSAENKYYWNTTLKFSWSHIIALIGLILLSYAIFMGSFYQSGDFTKASITVIVIDVVVLAVFIGVQQLKGTDERFETKIVYERILMIVCPIVLLLAIIPAKHFGGVYTHKDEVERNFSEAVGGSKGLFEDYQTYCENRQSNYAAILSWMQATDFPQRGYEGAGSEIDVTQAKKDNYALAMRLFLDADSIQSMRNAPERWLDEAGNDPSIWNAFLLGNIDKIDQQVGQWQTTLQGYVNERPLAFEGDEFPRFESNSLRIPQDKFRSIKESYHGSYGFGWIMVAVYIVLYLLLIFPYLLQQRNTKAQGFYRLIPLRSGKQSHDNFRASYRNDPRDYRRYDNPGYPSDPYRNDPRDYPDYNSPRHPRNEPRDYPRNYPRDNSNDGFNPNENDDIYGGPL